MIGSDQYGRRLLLWGDTAEIFSFTFLYTDALPSVYEISSNVYGLTMDFWTLLGGKQAENHTWTL